MKRANPAVKTSLCVTLLFVILLLAACGDGNSGSSGGEDLGGSGKEVGVSAGGSAGEDVAMREDQDVASGPDADLPSSASGSSAGSGEALAASEGFGRKVVKTADVGLEAENVRSVAEAAQRVAANNGGSVLQSEISGSEDEVSAYMTLSVPAEEFEATLDALRELGKEVVRDTVSGQDVTEEFVDLESRERNLLAAESSLLELYGRAETVEDTLTIERELTNIRGQIEGVQGRLQYLENRTSYSQISVSVEPVAAARPQPPGWEPLTVAADAWAASLSVLQGVASAAIAALAFGWWTLPLLIGAYLWWRRRRTPAPDPTEA
jgi:hypothetical protein